MQRKSGLGNAQNGNKGSTELRRSGLLQRFDPRNNLQAKGPLPRSQTLPDFDRPKLIRQPEVNDKTEGPQPSPSGLQKFASATQMTSAGALRSALKSSNSENRMEPLTIKTSPENGQAESHGPSPLSPSKLNEIHEEIEIDVTPTPDAETRTHTPTQNDTLILTPSALRAKSGKMQWPPVQLARRLSGGTELGGAPGSPMAAVTVKEKEAIAPQNGNMERAFPASLQGERWWCLLHTPKPPLDQILPSYMKTGCIAARYTNSFNQSINQSIYRSIDHCIIMSM
jgi:hypothetical protein